MVVLRAFRIQSLRSWKLWFVVLILRKCYHNIIYGYIAWYMVCLLCYLGKISTISRNWKLICDNMLFMINRSFKCGWLLIYVMMDECFRHVIKISAPEGDFFSVRHVPRYHLTRSDRSSHPRITEINGIQIDELFEVHMKRNW